jgi:transcriptional regulator with XRE-family HTH domain
MAYEVTEQRGWRQQLSAELRRLRDQAGISGRELARLIGISQSKVSRIESGTATPTLPQVKQWAEATRAPAEQTRSLIDLAERALTEIHTWRMSLQARSHRQDEIREREARARMTRTFQPSVVPGLLQTAEYARLVFGLSPLPNVRAGIPAAVAGRLDRQLALYEREGRFEFLITESALRWHPGPDSHGVLRAQLDRIVSLSTLENVLVGVIPYDSEALTFASHGFVIYEGRDHEDTFVTIEAIHASLTVHDPDSIAIYRETWSALRRMAIFDDQAREFLAELMTDVRVSAK